MKLLGFMVGIALTFGWSGAVAEEASLAGALEGLKGNLFSVSCSAAEENLYSDWSICAFPHGDLRRLVTRFVRDARSKGCKMPSKPLVRVALKSLRNSHYRNHPLYRKIPSSECGFCGRKAQCCRKARSFLTQTFRSSSCAEESPPCETEPLDEETMGELRERYPGVRSPSHTCDFAPYVERELQRLRQDQSFTYIRPLFCQIIGTTRPTVSCTKVENKCFCCCVGYKYEDGQCVEETSDPDPECSSHVF